MEQNKIRKVFIETLPKDNRMRVDWISSGNNVVDFIYDEVKDTLK